MKPLMYYRMWPRTAWLMFLHYSKYKVLKLMGKKPVFLPRAQEWDEYCPGQGVYLSDGVYVSLYTWAIMQGFTPMWREGDD